MLARMLLNDSPFAHITRQMAGEMDRFMSSYAAPGAAPALNAWQSDEAITVEAELPGYRLEDISVDPTSAPQRRNDPPQTWAMASAPFRSLRRICTPI